MQKARAGLQPELFGTLALRSLCTKLASALRVAPKAVFSNQAPLQRRAPALRCHAIMGQRDIASFFTKPAGAAAKTPSSRAPANSAASKRSSSIAAASAKPEPAPGAAADAAKAGGAEPEVLKETKHVLTEVHSSASASKSSPVIKTGACTDGCYRPINCRIAELISAVLEP